MGKPAIVSKETIRVKSPNKKDSKRSLKMVSTAGLEPARVSPHAPQTCAYTDSATSTHIQFSFYAAYTSPLIEMTFSHFSSAECRIDKVINCQ